MIKDLIKRTVTVFAAAWFCGGLCLESSAEYVTAWGGNDLGQLQVPEGLSNCVQVAAGYAHALAIISDGTVVGWGDDRMGQATVPRHLENALNVSAGWQHSVALKADGTVVAWGDNSYGQATIPASATNLAAVAAGGFHNVGLRGDGSVVCWGMGTNSGSFGQSIPPLHLTTVRAVAAGAYHSLALLTNGTVLEWGFVKYPVPSWLTNVSAIASGFNHSLALLSNGTVVAWGYNGAGQTNVPVDLSNVVAVATGLSHSLALLRDGTVRAWGGLTQNESNAPALSKPTAIAAGAGFSVALARGAVIFRQPVGGVIVPGNTMILTSEAKGSGPLHFQWQRNGIDLPGETNCTVTLANLRKDQDGAYRIRVESSEGTSFSQDAWLYTPPSFVAQPQSQSCFYGSNATFAVAVSGTPPLSYAWFFGNSPIPGASDSSLTIPNVTYRSNGSYSVVCSNPAGSVTSTVVQLAGSYAPSTDLTADETNILYDGQLYISSRIWVVGADRMQWQLNGRDIPGGTNGVLQLTNARPSWSGVYRFYAVNQPGRTYSPEVHVIVNPASPVNFEGRRLVLDAGTAYGTARGFQWSRDGVVLSGQTNSTLVIDSLSLKDAGNYSTVVAFDDGAEEFNIAKVTVLPTPAAGRLVSWGYTSLAANPPLSSLHDVVSMIMGEEFILALRADGKVFQMGYNGTTNSVQFDEPVVGLSAHWGAGLLGVSGRAKTATWDACNPCPVLDGNRFVSIAQGISFAIGLRNDGTAVGWGANGSGQSSVPIGLGRVIAIAAGYGHALALQNDGTVVAWGDNSFGQTGIPREVQGIKAIACGGNHSLALASNGTVFAWGYNNDGQCDVPANLTDAVAIGAGANQSYAVRADGTAAAWGDDTFEQCEIPAGLSNIVQISGGNSGSVALTGSTNAPQVLEHPTGGIVEVGGVFTFRVRAWSSAGVSFQWQHNGTDIDGATKATLALTNIQLSDAGGYAVVVSTFAGSASSDSAQLLVNPAPHLSLPDQHGSVVAWGSGVPGAQDAPWGIGEVCVLTAAPTGDRNVVIGKDGRVTTWGSLGQSSQFPTNLVSVVPWSGGMLGLRRNGIVGNWYDSGIETNSPAIMRDIIQLASSGYYVLALRSDGVVITPAGTLSTELTNIVQISMGKYHSVGLRRDGTVALSGLGYPSEQSATPAGLSGVMSVAAGANHTLALQSNGLVVAWGRNAEGQCTVPLGLSNVIAIAAGANHSMALRANGTIAVWGDGSMGQLNIPVNLTNVVAIAAGDKYCLALRRGPVLLAPLRDLTVVPGQAAVFQVQAQGTAPLRYQWRYAGTAIPGATNSDYSVIAGTNTTGLYSVFVSNQEGAVNADAMLWLGQPPEILAQPTDWRVRSGVSITMTALASGIGPLSYQWVVNGLNIPNASSPVYTVYGVTLTNAGCYSLVVSNSFGTVTSRLASVVVGYAPQVTAQPATISVAVGENAILTGAVISGTPPFQYQWLHNGTNLPGATNLTMTLHNAVASDAGSYSFRAVNDFGSGVKAVQLSVVAAMPQFVSGPTNQTAGYGDTVVFQAQAMGASPLNYRWYHDGTQVSANITNSTLVLAGIDASDEGLYWVTAENIAGTATTLPARLSLTTRPNVVIWGTNASAQMIPSDLTNAVGISASMHVLALRDDGTVSAWGSNTYGQATVPAGLSNVVAVSAGESHSLALLKSGQVVAWGQNDYGQTSVPAGLTNVVSITAGGLHNVAICSNGNLVAWSYNVFGQSGPFAGFSNAVSATANHNSTLALGADGTLKCWGNGYFPPVTASNVVKVMGRARILALRADGRIVGWDWTTGGELEGPAGVVVADSYTAPYYATPTSVYPETHEIGLLNDGTLAVWGTNRGGIFTPPAGLLNVVAISAGYYFNAAVVSGPTIVRRPSDQTIAAGSAAVFTVEATGHAPLTYLWRFQGTNITGSTNASLQLQSAQPWQTGDYTVVVTDAQGHAQKRTARLTVLPDVPSILRQPVGVTVTEGSLASFQVEAVGSPELKYQWLHNGFEIPGAAQPILNLPSAKADDAGVYAVRVVNANGQALSENVVLAVGLDEIIVDNTMAQVTGSWRSGTGFAQIGTNFLFIAPGGGENFVRFAPALPRAGEYWIDVRGIPSSSSNLAIGNLCIHDKTGVTGRICGSDSPDSWLPVGQFSFSSGVSGFVSVSDSIADPTSSAFADAVRFRYIQQPPVIDRQPVSVNAREGSDATFAVAANGVEPMHYQWQLNGTNIAGASDPTMRLANISRTQAGVYRVLTWNADGAVLSQEAQLSVFAAPISVARRDGKLFLDWEGEGSLLASTNVAGPYTNVPVADRPVQIVPENSSQFFRLLR